MALTVHIKVVPRSGRNEWKLDKKGYITCYLKSAPEKGLANKELVQLIAKGLRVPQSDITIISGLTSRLKKVAIELDLTQDQLVERLGIHHQLEMFAGK